MICLLGIHALFADSIPIPQISLSPYMEVSIGDAREYVYYQDEILSELIWDMKPMKSIGLAANVGWKRGLQISADFSAGIPAETGSMQDSDWQNLPYSGVPNWKTNYSEHDAKLLFAWQAAVLAGWELETPVNGIASANPITVEPSVGFRYMTWKWDGVDGYGFEQPLNPYNIVVNGETKTGYCEWPDADKVLFSGKVISYQQEYWMPTAGVSVRIPVAGDFRLGLGVSGSLWVWCNDLDNHHLTGYNFYDYMSAGWMVEPKASAYWKCFRRASVFLEGKWTLIGGLRGTTDKQSSSGGTIYSYNTANGGGAALNTVTIRVGIETKILQ